MKKIISSILVSLLLVTSISFATVTPNQNNLTVSYIDVGQADCQLIQTPGGKNIFIDAGNNDDFATIDTYLKGKSIKVLDAVIATHPHEDHIGAMDDVIKNYDVKSVYAPKATHITKTFEDFLLAVKAKNLKINTAHKGVTITIDPEVKIEMLSPEKDKVYEDFNDYSPVIKMTYKKNKFMFTGDAEKINEDQILIDNKADLSNLKVDVLKVGHHGSTSSTSPAFAKALSPKYAVISVEKDNSYGHPDNIILNRLSQLGTKVYRTDLNGTIVIKSDGTNISVSNQNNEAPPVIKPPANNMEKISNPETTNDATKTKTVYITKTGTKYHSNGCSYLSSSKISISLDDAISKGFTPCSKCKP